MANPSEGYSRGNARSTLGISTTRGLPQDPGSPTALEPAPFQLPRDESNSKTLV